MMKVKLLSAVSQIQKRISADLDKKKQELLHLLDMAGELAISDQTLKHKYKNQTGNLSSSVTYVVLDNGRVVTEGASSSTNSEGAKQGKSFIDSLIANNAKGVVLIVSAGMNYAAYVEDMGLDVLTTAELVSARVVKNLIDKI